MRRKRWLVLPSFEVEALISAVNAAEQLVMLTKMSKAAKRI
jgi:hypothetical protein